MKRLRTRDRHNAPLVADPSTADDPAAGLDAPLPNPLRDDEVWDMAGTDAAAWDMSGDVIRQALGIDPVERLVQPVSDLVAPTSDESLTWLESVPSATNTSELAAFITEGERPQRARRDGVQAWVVSIEELAEATGTTVSAFRRDPATPDLQIDWDAVATVPRVTARRSAHRWERRIQSESERRIATGADMSGSDVARLREVLDEGLAPSQRRSA